MWKRFGGLKEKSGFSQLKEVEAEGCDDYTIGNEKYARVFGIWRECPVPSHCSSLAKSIQHGLGILGNICT